ncbi:hypothetical protein NM688_g3540 [Phlebia brevispora]|uniref:Uncharacterized protein n=1 Tax=Phlebia brevispora TaxID=194682 RepID=A0ACC1T591_9APHY|nr:hypothetical protein NM688_g3540 [Phlebia brevispora]
MDTQVRLSTGQDLAAIVRDAQASAMCSLAAAVIVLYDCGEFMSYGPVGGDIEDLIVVTMNREMELVWRKRWSLIKAIYLFYRYFGLFCVLSVSLSTELSDTLYVLFHLDSLPGSNASMDCAAVSIFWIRWEASCYTTLTFISEAVLILWIWVAYNRSQRLLVFLSATYVIQVISVVAIIIQSFLPLDVQARAVPRFALCAVTQVGSTIEFLWIPILGFDSILLVLFTYKGLHIYCSRSQRERFGVMYMVYKHTLPTFLAIVSSYLVCAIMWLTSSPGLKQIPESFALCFSVINCTRLLLNIRRAYYIGNESARPSPRSTFTEGARTHLPISRNRRESSSFDLDRNDEIVVSVCVEVTRTCEEFGSGDWEYEMTEMRSATI